MTLHSAKGLEFPRCLSSVWKRACSQARCRWMKWASGRRTPSGLRWRNPRDAELTLTYAETRRLYGKEVYHRRRALSASCRKSVWKRCACAPGKPPGQPSTDGYADGRERQRYKLGQRVRHAKFGEGTIVNWKAAANIAVCRWHSRARVLKAGGGLCPVGDGVTLRDAVLPPCPAYRNGSWWAG